MGREGKRGTEMRRRRRCRHRRRWNKGGHVYMVPPVLIDLGKKGFYVLELLSTDQR